MKLTNKTCQSAKPREKPYKMADGGGLYLYVQKDGVRYWRMKYYYLSKEKLLAFGVYQTITLAEARDRRDIAKKLLANGQDPSQTKRTQKRLAIYKSKNTFEAVALC